MNLLNYIFLSIFLIGLAYGSHVPLIPVFARTEFKASYIDIGNISMANAIPYAILPLMTGVLLDKFNKGIVMSIGVFAATLAIFTLSFANNVIDIILVRACSGIAYCFIWPAASSIVTSNSKSLKSISTFTMFWVTGYMLGPLVGSAILARFGFKLLFYSASLFMLSAFFISLVISKRLNILNNQSNGVSIVSALKTIKVNLKIYSFILYYSASFGIALGILPAYIKENGISEVYIGLLFFAFGLARLLTLIFIPRLDIKPIGMVMLATFLISLSMFLAYYFVNLVTSTMVLLMLGFSFSVYYPVTLSIITKKVPNEMVGRYIGSYETMFGIGFSIGPLFAGLVAENLGNNIPYLFMFIIGLLFTFSLFRLKE